MITINDLLVVVIVLDCYILVIFVLLITNLSRKIMELGKRILALRKQKNFSQSDLAKAVGITYAQIGRYETKGTQPSAEVLKKIADALDTTTDYLMYGDKDEKAMSSLNDAELLQQFKAVDSMDNEDKQVIKKLIDAFITKSKLKQLAL